MWVAGAVTENGWTLTGVYSSRDKAIERCRSGAYFIAPINANERMPERLEDLEAVEHAPFNG